MKSVYSAYYDILLSIIFGIIIVCLLNGILEQCKTVVIDRS